MAATGAQPSSDRILAPENPGSVWPSNPYASQPQHHVALENAGSNHVRNVLWRPPVPNPPQIGYSLQKTPAQFGPRIRTHPSLSITSRLKMQAAIMCEMSYGGHRCQTILFKHKDIRWLNANISATQTLLAKAARTHEVKQEIKEGERIALYDVPVEQVLEFFKTYRFHERNREFSR